MICRDEGNDWLLITQPDHAHLAAEIASCWQLPNLDDRLVETIRHHDDGWKSWEQSPTISPETGEPRSFLDMPMETAVKLWEASIAECAFIHPLGGIWTSRHFVLLATNALETRLEEVSEDAGENAAEIPVLEAFLRTQEKQEENWFLELIESDGWELATVERESQTGFEFLKFFDHFSLLLCCSIMTEPKTLNVHEHFPVQIMPEGHSGQNYRFQLNPSCLNVNALELSTTAHRVKKQKFISDDAFREILNQAPMELLTFSIE